MARLNELVYKRKKHYQPLYKIVIWQSHSSNPQPGGFPTEKWKTVHKQIYGIYSQLIIRFRAPQRHWSVIMSRGSYWWRKGELQLQPRRHWTRRWSQKMNGHQREVLDELFHELVFIGRPIPPSWEVYFVVVTIRGQVELHWSDFEMYAVAQDDQVFCLRSSY